MTLASSLPVWVLALVVAAVVALAVRTYAWLPVAGARRAALVGLRTATLLALVVFLMRPVVTRPLPPSGNVVPIVIDASRSMAITEGGRSRFDRAVALADGPLAAALRGFHPEILELRNDVARLDPTRGATGDSSDLGAALAAVRDRYRGRAMPGIVLLSDGVDTSGGVEREMSDVAVFPIAIGEPTPPRDQEVLSMDLDPEALPGSSVELQATVVANGYGTEPLDVRLLASGRPVEIRRVTPAADGLPVRVTFMLPPAGPEPIVYSIEIPARPGEAVLENNTRHALVQPIGRRRRVLFVQGAPGYEHGFLSRAWATDPYLDVDIVVRKGQNDHGAATFYVQAAGDRASAVAAGVPTDRAALFTYDAVVLGNATRDLFTAGQLDALDAFVSERGGGLLLFGGRSFTAEGLAAGSLRAMLPVAPGHGTIDAARVAWRTADANKLTLTADGERHAMLRVASSAAESLKRWTTAPALAGIAPVGSLRPAAQVLAVVTASSGARPLIAVQRYGEGRSMVFSGEASWRWKMQRPIDDRLYDTFWRQVARWLSAPSPDPVAIDVDADARPGNDSTISVTVRDDRFEPIRDAAVEIVIRSERGAEEVLRASLTDAVRGRYTASWQPPAKGLFRLRASIERPSRTRTGARQRLSADGDVLAGGVDLETVDPRVHEDVLTRLAEHSGGRLIAPGELNVLAQALRKRAEASPTMAVQELWHGPWTFLTLIGLLALEWTLRRHWGLR